MIEKKARPLMTETTLTETPPGGARDRSVGSHGVPASWQAADHTPVPVADWGKDHYSTLAYVDCRTVDHKGRLDHDHMRCSGLVHPVLLSAKRRGSTVGSGSSDGREFPTRLRGGAGLAGHDDYSCLDDMLAAGLLTVAMPTPRAGGGWDDANGKTVEGGHAVDPALLTGLAEASLMHAAVWALTPTGRDVAGRLRTHKAAGGNFAGFAG